MCQVAGSVHAREQRYASSHCPKQVVGHCRSPQSKNHLRNLTRTVKVQGACLHAPRFPQAPYTCTVKVQGTCLHVHQFPQGGVSLPACTIFPTGIRKEASTAQAAIFTIIVPGRHETSCKAPHLEMQRRGSVNAGAEHPQWRPDAQAAGCAWPCAPARKDQPGTHSRVRSSIGWSGLGKQGLFWSRPALSFNCKHIC